MCLKITALTQRVHWGRPSAALLGWGSVCSTFPSRMLLAWRPLPVFRSQSCRGRWRQSSDTQWSSCSGRFGLRDSIQNSYVFPLDFNVGSQLNKQGFVVTGLIFMFVYRISVSLIRSRVGGSRWLFGKKVNTIMCVYVCFICVLCPFPLSSRCMSDADRPLLRKGCQPLDAGPSVKKFWREISSSCCHLLCS